MTRNSFKNVLARSIEGLITMLLVLAFFSILLSIMNTLFPSGSGLQAMLGRKTSDELASQGERKLLLAQGGHESDLTETGGLVAVLTGIRNTVKSRRADTIAWAPATTGMSLHNRDAVQTLNRSSAVIKLDENSYLKMGDNSLVIIKRLEQDLWFPERRSFKVVTDGEIWGRIAGSDHESVHVELTTPGAVTRIQSRLETDGETDFKISVAPDKSSTVTVYQGAAEVEALGEKVQVINHQSTMVELNQAPSAPISLPDPVELKSPLDGSVFYYRELPPQIQFTWKGRPEPKGYHFVLSRDPSFSEIVIEEQISKTGFTHGNLRNGTYFWRVNALDGGGEGLYGETRQIQVVQDQKPPMLSVQLNPPTVTLAQFTLHGKTEPGSSVFVESNPVTTSTSGEFQHQLRLQPGINVVVVEAVDASGNVAYSSQLINGKF